MVDPVSNTKINQNGPPMDPEQTPDWTPYKLLNIPHKKPHYQPPTIPLKVPLTNPQMTSLLYSNFLRFHKESLNEFPMNLQKFTISKVISYK